MKYISLFSGIEAATVAWQTLGWEPVAYAEIEPFPKAVLKHHYPNVPDLGDMTKVNPWKGKKHTPDSPRYKALGNSMAVPVMRWIGEGIQLVEDNKGLFQENPSEQ